MSEFGLIQQSGKKGKAEKPLAALQAWTLVLRWWEEHRCLIFFHTSFLLMFFFVRFFFTGHRSWLFSSLGSSLHDAQSLHPSPPPVLRTFHWFGLWSLITGSGSPAAVCDLTAPPDPAWPNCMTSHLFLHNEQESHGDDEPMRKIPSGLQFSNFN